MSTKPLSPDEIRELRLVLAWCKEQLPPHDLHWEISAQSFGPRTAVEGDLYYAMSPGDGFRVEGRATCQRCGATFPLPTMGSLAHSEEFIPRTVERLKADAEREAERRACWGDVPEIRDDYCIAVLDGTP